MIKVILIHYIKTHHWISIIIFGLSPMVTVSKVIAVVMVTNYIIYASHLAADQPLLHKIM